MIITKHLTTNVLSTLSSVNGVLDINQLKIRKIDPVLGLFLFLKQGSHLLVKIIMNYARARTFRFIQEHTIGLSPIPGSHFA